jgi:cobalamin biosynthesis Mg chelatase CobN
MDVATKLLAQQVREVPTDLDRTARALREILHGEIANVESVAQEKFNAIDGTFASNALALTAALAAQKEAAAEQNKSNTLAITKSEQATKETIAANAAQTTAGLASQAATISDLKDRLVRLEAGGVAQRDNNIEHRADATYSQTDRVAQAASMRANMSLIIGAIGGLVAIIAVLYAAIHG